MTTYRLALDRSAPVAPPVLDEFQQSVVDHPGGPLLVLAGPGTGKTTTLVEAIVDRIEHRGASPDSVLALTFSRKAAEQLRDRVTARLGRTMATTLQLDVPLLRLRPGAPLLLRRAVRRAAAAALGARAGRRAPGAARPTTPSRCAGPTALRAAVGTRGFAREVHTVLSRARERGLDPDQLVALGRAEGVPEFEAAGLFLGQYLDVLGDQSAIDYPDLIARAVIEAQVHRDELRARFTHVFVDEYQDTDPSQVALLRALAGDGRDLTVVGDPDQSIYGFRGADVRGILDFPDAFPPRRRRPGAGGRARHHPPLRLAAAARVPLDRRLDRRRPASIPREQYAAFRSPEPADNEFGHGSAEVLTFDTARAETEHVADLLRRAHLEDGVGWSDMAVLVRSGRGSIPSLRRSLAAAGVPVEVASDETPLVREPAVLPLLGALAVVDRRRGRGPAPRRLRRRRPRRGAARPRRSAASTRPTCAR